MSGSMGSKNTQGIQRVCLAFVDSGGFCKDDCQHLHPANLPAHVTLRATQLRNGAGSGAQSIVCEQGNQCPHTPGRCVRSHAVDVRGPRRAAPVPIANTPALSTSGTLPARPLPPRPPARARTDSGMKSRSTIPRGEQKPRSPMSLFALQPTPPSVPPTPLVPRAWLHHIKSPADVAGMLTQVDRATFGLQHIITLHRQKPELFTQACKDAHTGWPLIFFACRSSQLDIFEYLLDNGTDPDIACPPGLPLLAYVILRASHGSILTMVHMLLRRGADPRALPLDTINETGGPAWGRLREKMRLSPEKLPSWWMAAPDEWIRNLSVKLSHPIRYELYKALQARLQSGSAVSSSRAIPPHLKDVTKGSTGLTAPPIQSRLKELAVASTKPVKSTRAPSSIEDLFSTSSKPIIVFLPVTERMAFRDLDHLSDAFGSTKRITLMGSSLCQQPEFRRSIKAKEDQTDQHWQLDTFLRDRKGEKGIVIISDILGNLASGSTTFRILHEMWATGRYWSKRSLADLDITNLLWLVVGHLPSCNTIEEVQDYIRRIPIIAPLLNSFDHIIQWKPHTSPKAFGRIVLDMIARTRVHDRTSISPSSSGESGAVKSDEERLEEIIAQMRRTSLADTEG